MDYDIDIVLKLKMTSNKFVISPTGRVSHCHRQSQRSQDMRKANGTEERFQTEGRWHRGIQFGKNTPPNGGALGMGAPQYSTPCTLYF